MLSSVTQPGEKTSPVTIKNGQETTWHWYDTDLLGDMRSIEEKMKYKTLTLDRGVLAVQVSDSTWHRMVDVPLALHEALVSYYKGGQEIDDRNL